MTTTEHTSSQPRAADGAASPDSAVTKDAVAVAVPSAPADESYRIAASLAHRPGA